MFLTWLLSTLTFQRGVFVVENKYLPDGPTRKAMEQEGVSVAEMNMLLLQKVEELTLYVIEQNKHMLKQQNEIETLKTEVKELKSK